MNAFTLSLVSSLVVGIISSTNTSQKLALSTQSKALFGVAGAAIGIGIYFLFSWIGTKAVMADSESNPKPSVRTTVVGLGAVLLVLSAPLVTWFVAAGTVRVVARVLGA